MRDNLCPADSRRIDRVVIINDDCVMSGGAAAIALRSALLLRERQVPVTFISGEEGGAPDLEGAGVDVVPLGGRHILCGPRPAAAVRGIFNAKVAATMDEWMGVHDTCRTVYHLHNWHKALSPAVFMALRKVEPRLFISAHDYFLACPNGGYFHYPKQSPCEIVPGGSTCLLTDCDRRHYGHKLWRVLRHQVRHLLFDLRHTRATVLAVHPRMVSALERGAIGPRVIRVLRNPATPWRETRVRSECNRNVFFVGRVDHDKGADLLAEAAWRAAVPLTVIGDGPLVGAVARAHPEAQLLGWLPREQIAQLIGGARMLVVPTPSGETFGLAAVEALTSGVPVIISRRSFIADEIVRGGFGLDCDTTDTKALTAAIAQLAKDDGLVEQFSRRAFAEAHALAPTPDEWCDALLSLYADALRSAGAPTRGVR